ncbi:hypothetical protein [Herbidospora sp. NBRC 101105]|uniref:hypothetical protein n=1 Tax=Herbidospora sp. NBRC 101105 TaxID=3032195 RepID=UPI0024A5AD40|nr:hypothetical protein [Herbidospora sp. NBRC 101105]GLX96563.1 hypothetical protein Hesp01_45130 [Herbidospora sp. NBRC 101105]
MIECKGEEYRTIKSLANNGYVSAEPAYPGDGYGMLRARADVVGHYEKFVIS